MSTFTAAAAMLQGMTAHYLTHSTYPLKSGDTCLVHAAAGGTGGLIVQMAKMLGARVFGTVSTEEKAQIAREHGADETILYTQQDFEAEARRLTGGRGVDVVYDSVGRTTFDKSLGSLRPRGTLALFGQSSGPVPPFDPNILNAKGSLLPHPPRPAQSRATRDELLWRAGDVLNWIDAGKLKLRIDSTYPLAEAAAAHRALEGRHTTGKLLLTVQRPNTMCRMTLLSAGQADAGLDGAAGHRDRPGRCPLGCLPGQHHGPAAFESALRQADRVATRWSAMSRDALNSHPELRSPKLWPATGYSEQLKRK
jgi:hypothetical protein